MPKKKRRDGKTTTTKGGRPVDLPKRKKQTAEVVRLRGLGQTWASIAATTGIPQQTAFRIWTEYWAAEHEHDKSTADQIRAQQTDILQRAQQRALTVAMDSHIEVVKDDPLGGTMKMEEFEKLKKMLDTVVKCSDGIAKLHGCNKPVEVNINSGTLSLEQFLAAAEIHVKPKK